MNDPRQRTAAKQQDLRLQDMPEDLSSIFRSRVTPSVPSAPAFPPAEFTGEALGNDSAGNHPDSSSRPTGKDF